jgi:hypothetical protein
MRARSLAGPSKGPALARRLIVVLVVFSMLSALVPVLPANADTITNFLNSGSTATLDFSTAGNKTVHVMVPDDATVTKATFDINGQEISSGQGFPANVSIDVGKDGTIDWAFQGTGVGSLGHQSLFADGNTSSVIKFTSSNGGTDTSLEVMLPKFAQIKDGRLFVSGNGSAVQPVLGRVLNGLVGAEEFGATGATSAMLITTDMMTWSSPLEVGPRSTYSWAAKSSTDNPS